MSDGRHSGRNLLFIREDKSPGLPAVSDATVEHVWASFHIAYKNLCTDIVCVCRKHAAHPLLTPLPLVKHTALVGVAFSKGTGI